MDPALLACAPQIAPGTLSAIIRVESGGNPLAININKGPKGVRISGSKQAADAAKQAIALGYSVDLGLMQVNSRNLRSLGYSVEDMFEPCTNIKAGGEILVSNYLSAVRIHGEGRAALLAALSAYNTGSFVRGFSNGYVARYFSTSKHKTIIGEINLPKMNKGISPYNSDTSIFDRAENSNAKIDIE